MVKTRKILFVEDNAEYAHLIESTASIEGADSISMTAAESLGEAREALATATFDMILLDLNLPDSRGLDTLRAVREAAPSIPVFVLTAIQDQRLHESVVEHGARGLFWKANFSPREIQQLIDFVVGTDEEYGDAPPDDVRHRSLMERMSGSERTSTAAGLFGVAPLRFTAPDVHRKAVRDYAEILAHAVDRRVVRVEPDLQGALRSLAEDLGGYRAGPRDVIQVHVDAIESKIADVSAARGRLYAEEGRWLVLELMGLLVSHYRRNLVWGWARAQSADAGACTSKNEDRE